MGNVGSFCCREDTSDADDRDERARILDDNCRASCDDLYNQSLCSNQSNVDNLSYGSISGTNDSKTQEQSALDKIYQRMATNLIDVAPGDSMVIQPAEFIERQKLYQAKLSQIRTPLPTRSSPNCKPPKHINNPTLDTSLGSSSPLTAGHSTHGILSGALSLTAGGNVSSNSNTAFNSTGNSPLQQINKSLQERRRAEYEPISIEDCQLINEISSRSVQAMKGLRVVSDEPIVTHFKP